MTKLEQFKKVCHKYLVIGDDTYIDVVFGVIMSNRLDSKPVWLYLVGPPSSGKTEIVQALSDSDEIYPVSRLTPQTLVSGKILQKKEKDPSLLPKWNGKTVIFKDFTALLSLRYDVFLNLAGLLRDAYDGCVRCAYGTGKDDTYRSKFGLIAAVTNAIDKHRAILADLGERFLTYRMPTISRKEEMQRCERATRNLRVQQTEQQLREAALNVLKLRRTKLPTLSDHYRQSIIKVAAFVARARCHVIRDKEHKEQYIPSPEVATRLAKQLCDLSMGLAIAREKRLVTKSEVRLAQKVAIDSLTLKRLKLIQTMLSRHPQHVTAKWLAARLRFPSGVIHRWLEDLYLLDLVVRNNACRTGYANYEWKLLHGTFLKQILETD